MAYIGKIPTAAALTASDITDGIITNAKLAQDIISADTALGAEPADTDELLISDAGVLKRMDYSHIKSSASIVSVGFVENTTRYALSNSSDTAVFTVTFVKTLAADASKIIVHGQVPGYGESADWAGVYFDCLTTNVTTHNVNDSAAFKGITIATAASNSKGGAILINQEWEDTTNLGAATHTFELGWIVRSGGSDAPFDVLNPTSSDDARMHVKSSTFTFFEVAI